MLTGPFVLQETRQKKDPYQERYKVEKDGSISILEDPRKLELSGQGMQGKRKNYEELKQNYNNEKNNYPYTNIAKAQQESFKVTSKRIGDIGEQTKKQIEEATSQEGTRNALAQQIAQLAGGGYQGAGNMMYSGGTPRFNEATGQYNLGGAGAMSAGNVYGSTDLASKLNFQVSDDQIINDYNQSKLGQLNSVVNRGNAQIAGIQERLNAAQTLLNQLPSGDARRASSQVYVNQLKSDLTSVQSAVTDATQQIKDFKPITMQSPEAARQITSFREYLQLPEERATQQLRQIDPESYKTAVGLGRQYRQMATQPLGETTTPQTEQLRQTIEQEALNQLRLGSTLGAEERRGYEQAIRGAQTARGNIFGLGPAVQEAAQIGAAGEQRKLARYGAAQQFLGSGETTGAAAARDLALREGLQQARLGAASQFVAGGPSLYNLGQARTGAQQAAFQNYVQANQALPGQFGQAPSTLQPFYQTTQPGTAVDLTNTFANLYRSMSDYQSSTYGAQVGAISRQPSFGQTFGDIAGGLANLIKI